MSERVLSYIYKITNILNLKVYIGETTDLEGRWQSHRRENNPIHRPLYRDIALYGEDNFKFEVIYKGMMTKRERLKMEHKFILEYDCFEPKGYNHGPVDKTSRVDDIFLGDVIDMAEDRIQTYLKEKAFHSYKNDYGRWALV